MIDTANNPWGDPYLAMNPWRLCSSNVTVLYHHNWGLSLALSPSYGRIKGVSLYTEALIQAMSGGGAQSNEQWWVGTLGLQTTLFDYTVRLATKERVESAA
jgi:hypothetical protein